MARNIARVVIRQKDEQGRVTDVATTELSTLPRIPAVESYVEGDALVLLLDETRATEAFAGGEELPDWQTDAAAAEAAAEEDPGVFARSSPMAGTTPNAGPPPESVPVPPEEELSANPEHQAPGEGAEGSVPPAPEGVHGEPGTIGPPGPGGAVEPSPDATQGAQADLSVPGSEEPLVPSAETVEDTGQIWPEAEAEADLSDLTVEQLKDRLRHKELAVSGTKDELIARLEDADKPLEDRTVDTLKEMLADRELPVSGTKPELVERLREHGVE